jgi:putative ABC transport system permease protein
VSADRWFRRLLRLLPSDARADYGSEMARVFREQRRDAMHAGRAGALRLWGQTIADLLAVGPREHLAQTTQDVRYALRGMRRNVSFVAVAILTLALGIGANTAIFSVVDTVLLRPLPFRDPDGLVAVWNCWDGNPSAALSDPEYLDYAEQSRTMTIAAASGRAVNVSGGIGDPERVAAAAISVNALDVLGTPPALGRGFRVEDAIQGAPPVTILSDGFWRRRFGADPSIVGNTISINGVAAQVVGVMRAGVAMPNEIRSTTRAELYVPAVFNTAAPRARRGGHYLQAFARLQPGTSRQAASAEMDAILRPLMARYPDEHDQGNFGIVVRPLGEDLVGDSRPVLAVLAGAVGLMLLLACANVANLILARGAARRRELAVRAALGASRFRMFRQLLTESAILSLAGAAAGLLVAYWSQRTLVALGGNALPRLDQLSFDGTVFVFAGGLAIGTTVLFGLLPAFQTARSGHSHSLNDGDRGAISGRARLRRALVVCQVSAAVVLMVAAGLLIKSFVRLTSVPGGFDAANLLTMRLSLPASKYPGREDVAAYFTRVTNEVSALPGVRSAAAGTGLPLAAASGDWSFDIEGRPRIGTRYPGAADWYLVTPGYFETLGVPLKRGRLPVASDDSTASPVVIINETTARTLFANDDPIGRRIRFSRGTGAEQPWRTIVGIVGDVRFRGLDTPPRPEAFMPYEQFIPFSAGGQARTMTLVVKAERSPLSLVSPVRSVLRNLDPEVPPASVADMASVVSDSVSDRRLSVVLISAFGVLALALALTGLYWVMAYSVAQRTRELGVRMALGATRASVLAMVVFEGIRMVLVGAVIGLIAALVLTTRLATMLYEVEPRDVSVLAAATGLLLLVALFASGIPARRATRVDPVVALRAD